MFLLEKKKLLLLPAFFLFVGFVFIENINIIPSADAATESSKVYITDSNEILKKESLQDEIDDVKKIYVGQLETYRRDEKEYRISLDQYEKHQTLASIERALISAKQAMLSRNEVLSSYILLLKLSLLDADGVELSQKNITLKKLDAAMGNLERFYVKIESSKDRDQLNSTATAFVPVGNNVTQVAQETLVLLAVGKLQAVYDKAIPIQSEIDSLVATDSGKISDAKKKRAINEMNLTTEEAHQELQDIWEKMIERRKEDQLSGMYGQLTRDLNPIYTKLSRVSSFMEEVISL